MEKVLRELEVQGKPRLRVLNKIDLLPAAQRDALTNDARTVHVSAVKGIGISTLLDRMDEILQQDALSRVRLRVPQREGKALSLLEGNARVFSREYRDGFVDIEAQVPESVLRKVRPFVRD